MTALLYSIKVKALRQHANIQPSTITIYDQWIMHNNIFLILFCQLKMHLNSKLLKYVPSLILISDYFQTGERKINAVYISHDKSPSDRLDHGNRADMP